MELADVGFGHPFVWLHQDLSASEPRLPTTVRPGLPQEWPTQVVIGALAADLVIVTAAVLVAAAVTVRLRRGARRRGRLAPLTCREGPGRTPPAAARAGR